MGYLASMKFYNLTSMVTHDGRCYDVQDGNQQCKQGT
jgi:hypothetical protein